MVIVRQHSIFLHDTFTEENGHDSLVLSDHLVQHHTESEPTQTDMQSEFATDMDHLKQGLFFVLL